MRRICVHEHAGGVYVCALHEGMMDIAYCLTCLEIDGHQCPIHMAAV